MASEFSKVSGIPVFLSCFGIAGRHARNPWTISSVYAVEAILAEAALANAQLAVAKALLTAEFRRDGATVEEAEAKAEEAVEKMATQLVFGRVPAQIKAKQRQGRSEVKVLYFRSLFRAEENGRKMVVPASDQPVQLVMFAL